MLTDWHVVSTRKICNWLPFHGPCLQYTLGYKMHSTREICLFLPSKWLWPYCFLIRKPNIIGLKEHWPLFLNLLLLNRSIFQVPNVAFTEPLGMNLTIHKPNFSPGNKESYSAHQYIQLYVQALYEEMEKTWLRIRLMLLRQGGWFLKGTHGHWPLLKYEGGEHFKGASSILQWVEPMPFSLLLAKVKPIQILFSVIILKITKSN